MPKREFAHRLFHGQPSLMRTIIGDFRLTINGMEFKKTERRTLIMLLSAESMTLTAIAARFGFQKGGLTPVLDRLEKNKLIKRIRSTVDRRSVDIALTARGRSIAKKVRAAVHGHVVKTTALLPARELRELEKAVDTIYRISNILKL
ncbi:MAG: MarR family transcriptional regulator [Spirochaetes bacterium]|nr:MarR family transcriptional regulator [Spirochaetota bacterium]